MSDVRRCLGCGSSYPPTEHACPKCGSHAGELAEVEKVEKASEAKQPRRRKT
jgi:rRNA maturation endonuclease Nob1